MISLKMEENLKSYLQEAVEKMGIPKVTSCKSDHHSQAVSMSIMCSFLHIWSLSSDLEPELTALMDEQGLNLFDVINPEVLPQDVSILHF